MWGQSDKSIKSWLHHISTERVQALGCTPLFTLHHPPTYPPLKLPLAQLKINSYKNYAPLNFLPLELLYIFDIWYAVILNFNQLKPVLVQLTQHHSVIRASTANGLKYNPFDYYTQYDHIKYVWADRRFGLHSPV